MGLPGISVGPWQNRAERTICFQPEHLSPARRAKQEKA